MSEMEKKLDSNDLMRRLFATGAHYGYTKSRNHPSTKRAIYGYKSNSAIIDLEEMIRGLEGASAYLAGLAMTGKKIILVGTKAEAKLAVERAAEALGVPFVASRWLGGTLTNFLQIKSRIDRMIDLKGKKETGALDVYTKKERLMISREIARLERYLSSLTHFTELPAAVIVADTRHDAIVVAEARKTGVKVVGLANTDCDVSGIDYPIIMNESSPATLRLVIDHLTEAYRRGLTAAQTAAADLPAPLATPVLAAV